MYVHTLHGLASVLGKLQGIQAGTFSGRVQCEFSTLVQMGWTGASRFLISSHASATPPEHCFLKTSHSPANPGRAYYACNTNKNVSEPASIQVQHAPLPAMHWRMCVCVRDTGSSTVALT